MINKQNCALLNVYNANSGKEHLNTIEEIKLLFINYYYKIIIINY